MSVIFDRAGALERVGGDLSLLQDLLNLCKEQCDARLMVLSHEVRHKNPAGVIEHVHLIRGSLGTVGAVAAEEGARALEECAARGECDRLEPLFESLVLEINTFFGSWRA
jgi:HPt (histidine-containing phosphotransfer) domain-containing protein